MQRNDCILSFKMLTKIMLFLTLGLAHVSKTNNKDFTVCTQNVSENFCIELCLRKYINRLNIYILITNVLFQDTHVEIFKKKS